MAYPDHMDETERRIIDRIVKEALDVLDAKISVLDGEGDVTLHSSDNYAAITSAIAATGMTTLLFFVEGVGTFRVTFVHGNGEDVIHDWSENSAARIVEKLVRDWDPNEPPLTLPKFKLISQRENRHAHTYEVCYETPAMVAFRLVSRDPSDPRAWKPRMRFLGKKEFLDRYEAIKLEMPNVVLYPSEPVEFVPPDPSSALAVIETLRGEMLMAAHICDTWADESRQGGWSTHQIQANRELAANLRAAVEKAKPAPPPQTPSGGDDELLQDANSWYSAAQLEEIERQKQEDAQAIWQVYFRLKGGDDIPNEKVEALGQVYNRLMKQTPSPQSTSRGGVSLLEAATFLLWHKDRGGNTEDCVEAWDALRSAVAAEAKPRSKCGICDGPHDNDALTDICTDCETRINEEGSP